MSEFQITSWRTIPSLVVARDEQDTVKVSLAQRFQEAIDEAAMQAGAADADAYMDGWNRSEWISHDGSPHDVAESVSKDLESRLDDAALAELISQIAN